MRPPRSPKLLCMGMYIFLGALTPNQGSTSHCSTGLGVSWLWCNCFPMGKSCHQMYWTWVNSDFSNKRRQERPVLCLHPIHQIICHLHKMDANYWGCRPAIQKHFSLFLLHCICCSLGPTSSSETGRACSLRDCIKAKPLSVVPWFLTRSLSRVGNRVLLIFLKALFHLLLAVFQGWDGMMPL